MDKNVKKIVLALDFDNEKEALNMVRKLKDHVGMFKVGKQLFTKYGPQIVKKIKKTGAGVFLDLKFHDIPNTVAMASREAVMLGVDMFNIHASGGSEMIKASALATKKTAKELGVKKPILLAVTVLTSIDDYTLKNEINVKTGAAAQVRKLALLTEQSSADGVVASPKEISIIRKECSAKFKILTPGIRPEWASTDDQKRIMTPSMALKEGADYIVIGRPVTKAENPVEAAKKISEEIKNTFKKQ